MMKAGDILRRAAELVDGDRAVTYGDMAILHENIAILWNAWILVSRGIDPHLTAEDVAEMESLLKKARKRSGEGTPDNYTDDAAYAAMAGELSEAPEPKLIEPGG
ncbi:MAG: DUF6378 domain-containing protein [Nitrospiraceae bacterium]